MSLKISRSRQARTDVLNHAYDIADKVNLNASDRFLEATEAAYKQIADMPRIGVPRDYGNPIYSSMRMWPLPRYRNYLIFYRVFGDEIEILRVLYAAQNIHEIFTHPGDE